MKRNHRTVRHPIIALVLTLSLQTYAQSDFEIGKPAPEIHVTDWIENVPADKDLSDKYIVLEFWTTWCGPCLRAVPHLNALQEKFSREDLYFISMTDESRAKVDRTLKRVDFHSIVVSDQTERTHRAYGKSNGSLPSLPMTVLIDEKGMIRWIGWPDLLTEQVMEGFLNGSLKEVNYLSKSDEEKAEEERKTAARQEKGKSEVRNYREIFRDGDILYHFELKRTDIPFKNANRIKGQMIFLRGFRFPELYGELFDVNPHRIVVPDSLSDQKFSLLYKNVNLNTEALDLLEEEILNTMQLDKHREHYSIPVHSVTIRDSSLLEETLNEMVSSQSRAGDTFIFKNTTIANMVEELSQLSEERFTCDESDEDRYDFIIKIGSFDEIKKSLNSYGLRLNPKEQSMDRLVFEFRN